MIEAPRERSQLYGRIAYGLAGLGVLAVFGCALIYWTALHEGGLSPRSDDWGSFGAFIAGSAGTILALGTLVALAFTLALQARELEQARNTVHRQIFDSTFFQLLHRFNEMLAPISAVTLVSIDETKTVTGRFAIQVIYTDLISGCPKGQVKDALAKIDEIYDRMYDVAESMLGPYFRTLYHVFKFVDSRGYLTVQEKIDYSNIARAQLSRYELALLFYNCLTHNGAGFKPLVEQYGILKHLNSDDLPDSKHMDLYEQTAFMDAAKRAEYWRTKKKVGN
jgi:hypothetical protein